MRFRWRSVSYAGQPFSFERVERLESGGTRFTWAVSHRGEFIGTMTSAEEITTRDFDVRCTQWLAELLGGSLPTAWTVNPASNGPGARLEAVMLPFQRVSRTARDT